MPWEFVDLMFSEPFLLIWHHCLAERLTDDLIQIVVRGFKLS